jgi:hypothetical protein
VFASCSQILLSQTAPSHYRSANLEFSTAPTTDLTRAPTSWGLVIRLFLSRRIDHFGRAHTRCHPGGSYDLSVLPLRRHTPHPALRHLAHRSESCFRHSYLLFKVAHRPLPACIAELSQDVIVPTMFFFSSHWNLLYCTRYNLHMKYGTTNAYTNRVSCPSNASCSYYYPPQTQRPSTPSHETHALFHKNWFHNTQPPRALVR